MRENVWGFPNATTAQTWKSGVRWLRVSFKWFQRGHSPTGQGRSVAPVQRIPVGRTLYLRGQILIRSKVCATSRSRVKMDATSKNITTATTVRPGVRIATISLGVEVSTGGDIANRNSRRSRFRVTFQSERLHGVAHKGINRCISRRTDDTQQCNRRNRCSLLSRVRCR